MEGSGPVQKIIDPDPGGPKTYTNPDPEQCGVQFPPEPDYPLCFNKIFTTTIPLWPLEHCGRKFLIINGSSIFPT